MSDRKNSVFTLDPVEPRRLYAAGFTASYFPTTQFTGDAVTRTDAAVAFNWNKTGRAASISPRAFSARWTGTLHPTASGRHAVYVTTEGGVRVWINHTLLLNKPAAPGVSTNYKIPVVLTAGVLADIQIEYRHDGGRGNVGITWAAPGGGKVVLAGDGVSAHAPLLADKIDHGPRFSPPTSSSKRIARSRSRPAFPPNRTPARPRHGRPSTPPTGPAAPSARPRCGN